MFHSPQDFSKEIREYLFCFEIFFFFFEREREIMDSFDTTHCRYRPDK